MIYMIYAHGERAQLADLTDRLSSHDFPVILSPLGLKAGSDEWKSVVEREMRQSQLALFIMTDKALSDETVLWRLDCALRNNLYLVPVLWEKTTTSEVPSAIRGFTGIDLSKRDEKQFNDAIRQISWVIRGQRPQKQCFISYSRNNSAFAQKLASDLRKHGTDTWRDEENIPAGANWDREIEKALRDCSYVIFVATPASVESENVQDEIGLAVNEGKPIIPVMLETCKLPLRVHRAQWIDFRGEYESALQKLVEQLGLKKGD